MNLMMAPLNLAAAVTGTNALKASPNNWKEKLHS